MTYLAIVIMIVMLTVSSVRLGGLVDCVSRCYYAIDRWFTIGMLAVALLIMPQALDACDSIYSFLMCGGIAFVGVASDYIDPNESKVHFSSALVSALCSVPFVAVVSPACLWLLAIALIGLIDKDRWLLYGELGCFSSVFASLLL